MASWWLAVFAAAITVFTLSVPVSGNMEEKLINDLLKMYVKNARPLKNSSDVMVIRLGLSFIKADLDEETHILSTIAYETLKWRDEMLVWDPKLYGGIKEIILDKNDIWTPDITLYNLVSEVDVKYGQGNAVVNFQGQVLLIRNSKSQVHCDFDSLRFPFDKANCTLTYGSWVYSEAKINLTLADEPMDLSDIQSNPTWRLEETKVQRNSSLYPCCPERYDRIEFKCQFARRSNRYMYVLFLPSCLLSILSTLWFTLPIHCPQRQTLGVLSFFAFFALLLYTSSLVPNWDRLPYFIIFLIFNVIHVTMMAFLNSLIVQVSNPERGEKVTTLMRFVLFEIFARLFCMKSIVKRNRSRHLVDPEFNFPAQANTYYKLSIKTEKLPLDPAQKGDWIDEVPVGEFPPDGKASSETDGAFIQTFSRRPWQSRRDDDDWERKHLREWEDVAKVTNRLFFVLFLLGVFSDIGTVFIQISAK